MINTVLNYIDRFRHDRRERLMLGSFLFVLAIIVTATVYWQLRYTGISMTNETYCGYEEHVHTEECYEYTLVCGLEETEGHTHSEECYEEQSVLVCTLEESEGHVHDESCYETQMVLVCGLEECEPHTHTDDCYEATLICEFEEHTHTAECLIDLNADVEDATIWEATLPELTGDIRTDTINIAYSQLGYTESTANYTLAEDGITHLGYTRYGTWYGSSYSDWDSIFVAFCLDYAGIEDEFTYNAGAYAWSVDLANLGYYQTADVYTASIGDVVFIDTDDDGKANISAIVVAIDETAETITVIQGNYSVTDTDGNTTDTVALVTYSTVVKVEETAEIVTLSAESEEIEESEETEEITPVILGYANITAFADTEEAEELTEEVIDETTADETEEEVDLDEDEEVVEETEEVEELEETDETILLATSATDYVTQVTDLYAYALTLTSDDSATAASVWNALMDIWEQIYAEEEAGTLALTDEEYDNVNALTDEVYYYFVDVVGYDPYGVMTVEEEDNGEGNEVASASNSATDTLYTDLESNSTLSGSSVTWTANSVSYEDGSFTMDLLTYFSIYGTDIANDGTSVYYIYLPEDVTVSDTILGKQQTGTDNNNNTAFHYYFMIDSNGNYYIQIVFDVESYYSTNSGSSELLYGKIDYSLYELDADDADIDDTSLTIKYGTECTIEIPIQEITTDGTETWTQDLTISKSATNYDPDTNSITYTIEVSSVNGTDVITLVDLLTLVNNGYGKDLTVESIVITSVQYQQTIDYGTYQSSGSLSDVSDLTGTSTTIDSSSESGSGYTYVENSDGTGYTIVLAPLSGTYTDDTTNTSYCGDKYIIKYTVTFSEETSMDTVVQNVASASSTDETGTITDTKEVDKSITATTVTKSGKYDSNTGTITWTITFNSNKADIAGYVLKDSMFASATDLTITGTAGTDYELITNTDGSVSIKFLATDKSDDSLLENDINENTYTITYTTTSSAGGIGGSGDNVYNIVEVYDGDTKVDDDDYTVNVTGGGDIEKTLESVETDQNNSDYIILSWKTSITVPETGITAGTTLYDYLSGNTWLNNDTADNIHQWLTYDQLMELFNTLNTSITIGTTEITSGYTLYASTNGKAWNAEWYSYDKLSTNTDSKYSSYKFTSYKIVFDEAVAASGNLTLEYETTADTSGISVSRVFANFVQIGSLSAYDSYTVFENVYKTDGDNKTGTTSVTSTDGTVTWKVYVHIDSTTTGEFVVTDTLPSLVSLSSVSVQTDYGTVKLTATYDQNGTITLSSGTLNNAKIEGTATENKDVDDKKTSTTVSITIPEDAYTTTSDSDYIVLTFTCTIDDWDDNATASYTYDAMTNSVSVTLDKASYGNSEQTQIITHEVVETNDHDAVEKSVAENGMGYDNYVDYAVALNIDGKTLNSGNALTFTDTLATTDPLTATLDYTSVKFYQLYELTESEDSGTYTYTYTVGGENGVGGHTYTLYSGTTPISSWTASDTTVPYSSVYAFKEDDGTYTYYYKYAISISWDYETVIPNPYYSIAKEHVLTAEIPDETPILVEYSYYIDYTGDLSQLWFDGKYVGGAYVNWTNKAYLTGTTTITGDNDSETVENYYEESTTGTISSAGGLTVYKSGLHTSDFIMGTEFELYMYDSGSGTFVSTGQVYVTDSNGSFYVTPVVSTDSQTGEVTEWANWFEGNTLYYLVETKASSGYLADYETKYYFYWSIDSTTAAAQNWSTSFVYDDLAEAVKSAVSESDISVITLTSGTTFDIKNTPITSFNLVKTSTSNDEPISGAVFALYEYEGHDSNGDEVWKRIGTYTTDKNGEITITYEESLYSFNTAYKLTEITPAEGYNIGYNDVTEFYFWWSNDDTTKYPVFIPTNWGDDTVANNIYATVYDIAAASAEVTATNTKTSTMITVTKAWVDTDGNVIDASNLSSNYSATAQLYFYLLDTPDGTGNAYTTSTSTCTELITISSTSATANTDVVFYSLTPTQTLSMTGTTWYSLSNSYGLSVSSLISAMSNSDYDDLYIEVEVSGGDQPTGMQLILQTRAGTEGNYTYPTIASVTPWTIDTVEGTTNYTAIYRVSKILSAIQSSGYSVSDIVGVNLALNSNQTATVTSFKVVGSGSTAISSLTGDNLPYTSTDNANSVANAWIYVDGSSSTASVEAQNGAVIALKYSGCTVSGNVRIGIQFYYSTTDTSTSYYKSVTVPTGSGTVYVSVADFTTDGGASISDEDWSKYNQTYVQLYNSAFVGTVESLSVIVPATSSSSYKTYYVVYDDSDGPYTCYLDGSYPAWVGIDGTATSTIGSYLQDDDAVIRVYYTATSDSETLYTVVQSWTSNDVNGYLLSDTVTLSDGSSYVDFYVSDFTKNGSFSWDSYNKVQIAGTAGVTVTDIKILLPYDVTEAVTGVIASNDISVTLYDPDFTAFNIYNGTVNGTDYGSTYYNLVVSTTSEAESGYKYNYDSINEAGGNQLRGFTFLDAIYSNLDSTVQITVTLNDTYSAPVDMLSHLDLIILGDLSVNYNAIADVAPTSVTLVSGSTYKLTYSSSEIVAALAGATAHYSSAAEACADYDSIFLALSGSYYTTSFSATVTDIDVVSTTFNTSDTYTYSNLLGTSKYGGTPYYTTDDAGNVTYYYATLDSSNNWTYSYANLPISFYDSTTDTTWYYYYYFVETSSTGSTTAYTTTYSQIEGENGGGEIVILNIETSYVLPSAGGIGTKTLYEFGAMLILLALCGAGIYRNLSRLRESLAGDPRHDTVTRSAERKRLPDVRNRKFVTHRNVRKGDTRAGPDG